MIIFGVGLVYALPFIPAMAGIWIQIDGIQGESSDKDHFKWIDARDIEWSVSRADAGGYPGPISKSDIKIKKSVDAASPFLFQTLVMGKSKPSAVIEVSRPTSFGDLVYYRLNLSDVFVTGLTETIDKEGMRSEEVSLSFKRLEMIYYPIDDKGGKGSPVSAIYDFEGGFSRPSDSDSGTQETQ